LGEKDEVSGGNLQSLPPAPIHRGDEGDKGSSEETGEREEVHPVKPEKIDPVEILNRIITENPRFLSTLRRVFYRQSLEMGLSMALTFTGAISLVNALTQLYNLAWKGWAAFGVIALIIGLGLTIRQGKETGRT